MDRRRFVPMLLVNTTRLFSLIHAVATSVTDVVAHHRVRNQPLHLSVDYRCPRAVHNVSGAAAFPVCASFLMERNRRMPLPLQWTTEIDRGAR